MKFTIWELEFLLDQIDKAIRRNISQQRSTKSLEKLRDKFSEALSRRRPS